MCKSEKFSYLFLIATFLNGPLQAAQIESVSKMTEYFKSLENRNVPSCPQVFLLCTLREKKNEGGTKYIIHRMKQTIEDNICFPDMERVNRSCDKENSPNRDIPVYKTHEAFKIGKEYFKPPVIYYTVEDVLWGIIQDQEKQVGKNKKNIDIGGIYRGKKHFSYDKTIENKDFLTEFKTAIPSIVRTPALMKEYSLRYYKEFYKKNKDGSVSDSLVFDVSTKEDFAKKVKSYLPGGKIDDDRAIKKLLPLFASSDAMLVVKGDWKKATKLDPKKISSAKRQLGQFIYGLKNPKNGPKPFSETDREIPGIFLNDKGQHKSFMQRASGVWGTARSGIEKFLNYSSDWTTGMIISIFDDKSAMQDIKKRAAQAHNRRLLR